MSERILKCGHCGDYYLSGSGCICVEGSRLYAKSNEADLWSRQQLIELLGYTPPAAPEDQKYRIVKTAMGRVPEKFVVQLSPKLGFTIYLSGYYLIAV